MSWHRTLFYGRMRSLVLVLLGTAGCSASAEESTDPLREPAFVVAVDTLVHLADTSSPGDEPHPGPAAVAAVEKAIRVGGSALKEAAMESLNDADQKRRLRANLALQTIGVSDAELDRLAGSPDLATRMWAILATDGFPRAPQPSERSNEVSVTEGRALVAQHAKVFRRLFEMDDESLAACSEDYQEAYTGRIVKMLERPAEHVEPLHARRWDVTGDGADDWICSGRFQTGYNGSAFLLVVNGQSGEVVVETTFDSASHVSAPKCIDVTGDGLPEVLVAGNVGNPNQQVVHVFGMNGGEPVEFVGRFVALVEDPVGGATWFVETSPFNAFGGTATMLASAYGAKHRVTRLDDGLRVVTTLELHTNVTAW